MPLTTGKDAQGRGIAGQGGLAALGDDAVLAHLLPAESLLRRAALGHPIVVRPDHEVVALVREPDQVRSIPQAPIEPQDDAPRMEIGRMFRPHLVPPLTERTYLLLSSLPSPGQGPLDRCQVLLGLAQALFDQLMQTVHRDGPTGVEEATQDHGPLPALHLDPDKLPTPCRPSLTPPWSHSPRPRRSPPDR